MDYISGFRDHKKDRSLHCQLDVITDGLSVSTLDKRDKTRNVGEEDDRGNKGFPPISKNR